MPPFTSTREKRLWLWALLVFAAIYATLFMGQPLARQLRDQNVQAVFFVLGMLLVGAAIIFHGIRTKAKKLEWVLLIGITALVVMFTFRLGAPERSHVMEYSILTIFIHKALLERARLRKPLLAPSLLAFMISFLVGLLDEVLQKLLPNRVFDPQDILFNGSAALMVVGIRVLLNKIRLLLRKEKN
ncbi:hypothetical protein GCM10028791_28090 [Echinicola sediminis]